MTETDWKKAWRDRFGWELDGTVPSEGPRRAVRDAWEDGLGEYGLICEIPITRGPRKGESAQGTWTGWARHRRYGEELCDGCGLLIKGGKSSPVRDAWESGEFERSCEIPISKGPRKGQPATGTPGGWRNRHSVFGDPPCDECLQAARQRDRDRYESVADPTTCRYGGHLLEGDNLGIDSSGKRFCWTCRRENRKDRDTRPGSVECGECGERFVHDAFEEHFVYGPGGLSPMLVISTCLTVEQMRAQGWVMQTRRAWMTQAQTHCKRGHELHVISDGRRQCRECARERSRRAYWAG